MQRKRKLWLGVFVLLIVIGFGVDEGMEAFEKYKNQQAYNEILPYTKAPELQHFDARMDALRTFVTTHSIHKIDELFKSYWKDSQEIARRTLLYAKGESDEKPHLECSTRSGMMGAFIKGLGYRTRPVVVFGMKDGSLLSHTFLEAQNPDTGKWQVQDPDLDLFYIVKETNERASIEDLIRLDIDSIQPCNSSGACGWDIKSHEDFPATKMHRYMGIASINDYQMDDRPLLVNSKRFDLEHTFIYKDKEGTFCEHLKKNCRDEIIKF